MHPIIPRLRRGALLRSVAALAILTLGDVTATRGQSITPSDTFQPWHAVMYRSVLSPRTSPDGRQVAFLRAEPRRPLQDENGPSRVALYVLAADGREMPFVAGEVTVSKVVWIDNEHLAFAARRYGDEHRAVYRISTRGGEAAKIFEFDRDVSAFDISRDGRWLAFLAVDEKIQARKDLEKKGFNHEVYEEDRLFTRLRIADLHSGDGSDQREIALVPVDGSVQSVEFAPDGRRLLVAVTPTPLVDATFVAQRLRLITRDGTIVGRIENPGKLGAAAWSPDGQRVALIAGADRHDPAPGRLMVVDAADGELRDLMPALKGHVAAFDWVDASTIAYVVDLGTGTEVGTIQTDGTGRRVLLPAGRLVGTSLDAHENGLVALVAQSAQHPDELYTLTAGGAAAAPY
jgi:dipeptidyl aminopeptidase/acylaminoacyl peptidase